MTAGSTSFYATTELVNGRTFVKRSNASARKFGASWTGSLNNTDLTLSLETIKSFSSGLYGSGPFYWVDPYAADNNLMPPQWAAPMLAQTDWPSISSTVTPTFTAATYANRYPIKYSSYSLPASHADAKKLTIIIPSTHTLNFGWHATAAGVVASGAAGIRILPYDTSGVVQAAVNPASLLAGGTTRTNQTFAGSSYSKVEIFLANGSGSTSVANIVAMIAQVLVTGTSVATGGFIPGKGTTALQFTSPIEIEYYSASINSGQIGLSTTFVEVD